MKTLKFNRFALNEMIEAARYLEDEQTGLGKEFLKTVKRALRHIRSFPQAGPIWKAKYEGTQSIAFITM